MVPPLELIKVAPSLRAPVIIPAVATSDTTLCLDVSLAGVYRTPLVARSPGGPTVTITLNRPVQMTAMNTAMGEDLLACFDALAGVRDVRAVVFTGAGDRAFCAGGDLKERNEMT